MALAVLPVPSYGQGPRIASWPAQHAGDVVDIDARLKVAAPAPDSLLASRIVLFSLAGAAVGGFLGWQVGALDCDHDNCRWSLPGLMDTSKLR